MKKFICLILLCFWLLASFSQSTSFANSPKDGIVVWRLEGNNKVNKGDVSIISNFVTNQVLKFSGKKVISEADIRTILKGQSTRQRCGSTDTSCVAEIGAALGVPEAISGDIGRLGSYWMLNLRRINVMTANVEARSSRNIQGNIDNLIKQIPGAVAELFGISLKKRTTPKTSNGHLSGPTSINRNKVQSQRNKPTKADLMRQTALQYRDAKRSTSDDDSGIVAKTDMAGYSPSKITTAKKSNKSMSSLNKAGFGCFFPGLVLIGIGGIASWQTNEAANETNDARYNKNTKDESDAMNRYDKWHATEISMYTIGGALAATGIILWIVDSAKEKKSDKYSLKFDVQPIHNGSMAIVSGSW